jgi:hypothetical protein
MRRHARDTTEQSFLAGERRPPAKIQWEKRLLAGEEAKGAKRNLVTGIRPWSAEALKRWEGE